MFNMRTACNAAHVKSVLWLLLNMLQHVLGNNLQFNFRARQVVTKKHHCTEDCYPRHAAACLGGAGVPTSPVLCTGGAYIEHL